MKFGLDDEVVAMINAVFAKFPEVEEVLVYGSRAKGNYRSGSDIDLTMKGEKLTEKIRSNIYWEIDDLLLPYMIDLSVYHQINNPNLVDHIDRIGLNFYAKH